LLSNWEINHALKFYPNWGPSDVKTKPDAAQNTPIGAQMTLSGHVPSHPKSIPSTNGSATTPRVVLEIWRHNHAKFDFS
jgi:hypothetical protein